MLKEIIKKLQVLLIFVLIFQVVGCGTIIYPERKGQKGGRIDVGIAILDGLGLLLFFVPGVIAFAVDFATGAIYLPGTAKSSLDMRDIKQVKFDPEQADLAGIERIILEETGFHVDLDSADVQISELKSIDDMIVRFAEAMPQIEAARTKVSMR